MQKMMRSPRVSIALPVYNGERYIRSALDSILSQTFTDFEVVISDNCSTDNTLEICKEYSRIDSRITLLRNDRNLGAAANFNRAFTASSGEYFKWAAHDDVIAPTFIEACVKALDDHPDAVLSYPSGVVGIDEQGKPIRMAGLGIKLDSDSPGDRFAEFDNLRRGLCYAVFGLIRRDALSKTNLIGNYVSSDRVLLAHLSLLGPFSEVAGDLFQYRDHRSRSIRAYSEYERAGWFDADKEGTMVLHMWRLFFEYARAVNSVDLPYSDRLKCYVSLLAWLRKRWKTFFYVEFKQATQAYVRMNFAGGRKCGKSGTTS